MSTVNNGPVIIKNSLILDLDASARRSFLPNSIINMDTWTVSTGSVTGYGQNGPTNENQRTLTTNPWGDTDVIWGSYPDGSGDADGGWNTSGFNIDKSKLYRFSVWIKRTSSTTGGTAYLGGTAWDASQYLKRTVDSVDEPNPYWFYSNIGIFNQNVWYLIVGHLYPFNTTYTGRHPDSGLYNPNNPIKVTDIGGNTGGGDFKFSSTATYAYHRVFHYYCGDNTSRLQFYDPRVDLVDGKEPSIAELVNYSPAQWRDLSGTGKAPVLFNKCLYNTTDKGSIYFDGLASFCGAYPASSFQWTPSSSGLNNMTIDLWIKTSDAAGTILSKPWNSSGEYNYSLSYYQFFLVVGNQSANFSFTSIATGNWTNLVILVSPTQFGAYINGVQNVALTNHGITNNTPTYGNQSIPLSLMTLYPYGSGWAGNTSFSVQGNLGSFRVYSKVLTPQEILQNYQATKSKFGL